MRPVRARDVDDELHEFVPDVGRRRFVVVRQEVLKRRPEEDGFIFSGAPGCLTGRPYRPYKPSYCTTNKTAFCTVIYRDTRIQLSFPDLRVLVAGNADPLPPDDVLEGVEGKHGHVLVARPRRKVQALSPRVPLRIMNTFKFPAGRNTDQASGTSLSCQKEDSPAVQRR